MALNAYQLFDEAIQKSQEWLNELSHDLEWPAGEPWKARHRELFLAHVEHEMRGYAEQRGADAVVRSVFRLLGRHVSEGELAEVKQLLPAEIRELWA